MLRQIWIVPLLLLVPELQEQDLIPDGVKDNQV